MNIVWQLKPDERLKEWRAFRNDAKQKDIEDILLDVIEWWKYTPVSSRVIDAYDNTDWPDPWQLLHKGDFDENSIALGMGYTLHLMGYPCDILLIQNRENHLLKLIVLVDKTHILNYTYGNIDKITVLDSCEVLSQYNTKDMSK